MVQGVRELLHLSSVPLSHMLVVVVEQGDLIMVVLVVLVVLVAEEMVKDQEMQLVEL